MKRTNHLLLPSILVLVLSLGFFGVISPLVYAQGGKDHFSGQVLVKFKDDVSQTEAEIQLNRLKARIKSTIPQLGVLVVQVPGVAEEKVVEALSRNPKVEFAELDYVAEAFVTPNDPSFLNQWGLDNTGQTIKGVAGTLDADIDGPEAWNLYQGTGVVIAVLDTGVDSGHPDLLGKISAEANFTDSNTAGDRYGHGTHVAGIVAAVSNNGVGVTGGCPGCLLMNGKVLNDSGSGAYSWIASGITWAVDNGAKVINMSLGGSSPSKTLEKAINYAWGKNVVVLAAAGNSGNQSKSYPGAYANVIGVAATDNKDKKASFSQYGNWVDVAAPGVNILSTTPTHAFYLGTNYGYQQGYDYLSGTSMATPMAAAVAGLIWSNPTYGTSNTAVRARLENTSERITGTGSYWIKGRINAADAVR